MELDCNEGILVAEIVPEAARELDIQVGSTIHAACKASAFRRLASNYLCRYEGLGFFGLFTEEHGLTSPG